MQKSRTWIKERVVFIYATVRANSRSTVHTQNHSTYRPFGNIRLGRNGGHTAKVDTDHGQVQNLHDVNDDPASQGSLRLWPWVKAAAHLAIPALEYVDGEQRAQEAGKTCSAECRCPGGVFLERY